MSKETMNTKTEAELVAEIESLQVQIVMLREALKDIINLNQAKMSVGAIWPRLDLIANSALSQTADYEGKVVVDKKDMKQIQAYLRELVSLLDSLRKGGE